MTQPRKRNKRFFEYGLAPGFLSCGKLNSIADVSGVRVGHFTKIQGRDIRTGITVIDPGVPNLFRDKIPAAIAVGNGYGKLAGYTQVEEFGTLETPIALTNTLAVGPVVRGIINLVLKNNKVGPGESINAIVGETNDGFLNNLHAASIFPEDVFSAYKNRARNFGVGNIGAGTGTRAFSWKGGIGTSSRVVKINGKKYALGVLMQTNFGGSLVVTGKPIGRLLRKSDFSEFISRGDGSCMIVIATDAPVSARQLKRIAQRAFLGLARTGSILANGSGDYAVAFSVSRAGLDGRFSARTIENSDLNGLFLATVEAAEESVYDALFAAETMTGRGGNTLSALPKEDVINILSKEH
ncbi:MAG: P1 family peptidase [Candidatus Liptonbacteria bacterium]